MGQKVNPISLRLQKTNRFYESSWYSNKNYNVLLSQDLTIRGYLNSVLKQIRYPQGRFFLKYMHKKLSIFSFLHNPYRSRKERANLLSSQRKSGSSIVRSKSRGVLRISKSFQEAPLEKGNQVLDFSAEGGTKKATATTLLHSMLHSNSKQSSRLRKRLNNHKKSFCYLKNLQNLNKQRVHSLFYLLHGLSCKEKTFFTPPKQIAKMSILQKQFYIRYFLACFFSRKSEINGYRMDFSKAHAENQLNLKTYSSGSKIKISRENKLSLKEVLRRRNDWKKILVNRFLMFRLLEKEGGALLSTKYSEKPIKSSLKDINHEIYPKTKNRYALINRAFTKFYSHFANIDKKKLTTGSSGWLPKSRPDGLVVNSSAASSLRPFLPFSFKQKEGLTSSKSMVSIPSKDIAKQVQKKQLVELKKVSTFIIKDTPYRNHLESVVLKRLNFPVEFFPFQAFSDSQSALFLANEIVFYLEQRVAFRRIKTRLFKDMAKKDWIKGIRITCSGRLGGRSKKAQRSKTECVKLGQTSLHVFSSKMDFAYKSALTPFGLIGVKVWISYV